MAEEDLVGAVAAAPVAPVVTETPAPAVAPVVETSTQAPVAEAAPVAPVETPPAPVAQTEPSSLLSDAPIEPVDTANLGELPPVGKALEYGDFTLPEGFQLDQDAFKAYTEVLGGAQVPQEVVQELVTRYADTVKRGQEMQTQIWDKTRSGWIDQGKSDPEIGGNRWGTTLENAKYAIERFGGSAQQIAELRQALGLTGAGDHPALVRFVANVGAALREGRPVQMPTQTNKASSIQSRAQRMYAGSK